MPTEITDKKQFDTKVKMSKETRRSSFMTKAQTIPESFVQKEKAGKVAREEIKSLDDVAAYLKRVILDELVKELKASELHKSVFLRF